VIWVSTIHGLPFPIGSLGWREVRRQAALVGGRKRPRRFAFAELSVLNVAIWGSFSCRKGAAQPPSGKRERGRLAVGSTKHFAVYRQYQ
jgi:hypothetical protein